MRLTLKGLVGSQASFNGQSGEVLSQRPGRLRMKLDDDNELEVDIRNTQHVTGKGIEPAQSDARWTCGKDGPVKHSGDKMNDCGGHHEIKVSLNKLPDLVSDLYFTLSAYHHQSLQAFEAPSIEIFDAQNRAHKLLSHNLAST